MKFRLLSALLLSLGLAFAAQEQQKAPLEPFTVFVLRHGETVESTDHARDPELSEAGLKRAANLATLLGNADVSHIFASEFKRTQGTVSDLAKAVKKEVKVISAAKAQEQLDALKALPAGSVVVICGHSNTVPGLVSKLGGKMKNLVDHPKYGPMLDSKEFNRLFMVTVPGVGGAQVKAVELRY